MNSKATIRLAASNLCYYDHRNPDHMRDEDGPLGRKEPCHCDNCFTGRNDLALVIMGLLEVSRMNRERRAILARVDDVLSNSKDFCELGEGIYRLRPIVRKALNPHKKEKP